MPILKIMKNKIKVMLSNNKITIFNAEEKDGDERGLFRPRDLHKVR